MSRHVGRISPTAWVICSLGIWMLAVVSVRASAPAVVTSFVPQPQQQQTTPPPKTPPPAPAKTQQTPPAKAPATTQAAAAYVGEDTCLTCHSDMSKGYHGSPHSVKTDARTPAAKQGCESCHGPGSKHMEDPAANPVLRFTKAKPDQVNATCTTCHTKGPHALWDGSQHETRGLSCITCHSVHSPKTEVAQLKAPQIELCAKCHRDKIAKLDRSGHMPVREGKMTCTSCHNVHGATNVRLLNKGDSPTEVCTACHAEKRGPYLWEHAPSRDGCMTCHDPHGTSNERMLITKPPLLCQRCHVATRHPSTIYDAVLMGPTSPAPSARVYGRSCVTCHAAIHGSNHPSGQRFIR